MDSKHQNCSPTVPPVAPSATSSIIQDNGHKITKCSLFNPPVSSSSIEKYSGDRGQLLGIVRPAWRKVLESEMRLDWLEKMVRKNLVVRDIEAYARAQSEKLRSEEMRLKEEERIVLMGLMHVKVKDEKRNLVALQQTKDRVRNLLAKTLGKGGKKFTSIIKELRKENKKRKEELRQKYNSKIKHLDCIRQKEIEEKVNTLPEELEMYKACKVFDKGKFNEIKRMEPNVIGLNGLSLSNEEASILSLNPKFAVMRRLSTETMETEVEVGSCKLRYEIHRLERKKREENV